MDIFPLFNILLMTVPTTILYFTIMTILSNIIYMLTNITLYKLLNEGCYSGSHKNVILYFVAICETTKHIYSGIYRQHYI